MMIMRRILAKAAVVLAAAAGVGLLVAARAVAGSSMSGTESFTLTTRSVTAHPVYHAVAKGVFSATGTVQATSASWRAPLKATFPGGTFMIEKMTPGKQAGTINPSNCAIDFTATGATYKISNGTGNFKGITGSGTSTITFSGRLPKLSDGRCNLSDHAMPVPGTALLVVHASGPVTVP
jgi:hypothetical protein